MLLRLLACAAVLALHAGPARGGPLLDSELSLAGIALAASHGAASLDLAVNAAAAAATPPAGMDFDLLGEPPPAPPSDSRRMRTRRLMLKTHQAVGLGMIAAQLGTTVFGQLNYGDKFGSDDNTNRYRLAHAGLAWTNAGLFTVAGGLALFAPGAREAHSGWDRVRLHKLSMLLATAGMATQVGLGIYTANREGFDNQRTYGKAHLAVGYATLAALVAGVGVIVF